MTLALRATAQCNPLAVLHQSLRALWQLPSSLLEILPPIILAVPKSKVSHSRKRMRSANKGLKEKLNIITCPGCGRAKRAHHLCPYCYSEISRGFKTAARQVKPVQEVGPRKGDSNFELPAWVRERGGGKPMQPGELLTKWMRRRAGFGKEDPPVRLGQEDKIESRGQRRQRQKNDGDDDELPSSGGAGLPPNIQFA